MEFFRHPALAVLVAVPSSTMVPQGTRPLAHHHKATTVEMAATNRTTAVAAALFRQVLMVRPSATGVGEAVRFPYGRRRPQRATAATSLVAGLVPLVGHTSTMAGPVAAGMAGIKAPRHRTELRIRAAEVAAVATGPLGEVPMLVALVARES
jgi:hypothetical protein